ncbi:MULTISPECIES: phage holin family protein [Kitasatospora]|uniref:Co/Zn/Cd cation transporter (Cation efflux family) n=2 Tax=Kitasatospora TaxID=2063 RepID=A0ABT1J832_9ACTN|nr:phage holin family protein [Kitasatospora paracochleata]MCP2312881.1 putative Co/Zn/Cd cation transporter (cation efflux family) [Kitasatospora paracochleata]
MAAGAADPSGNQRTPLEGERSFGQLFAAVTADLSALVHDEIALAKAEIRTEVKRGVGAGVSVTVAGVVALAAIPMLSFAAAYGLRALGLTLGWSFLIVGGVYLLVAITLGLLALRSVKKIQKPERAIAGAQATADVLKNARPRPATKEEIDRALGRIP